jgi:uncharacterized protein
MIIDTDIHNAIRSNHELAPYLSSYWKEILKLYDIPVPAGLYKSAVGVLRCDATPPDGGPSGSDPQHVINHHLDPYQIDYGILNGSGILGISVSADPDYANAIASAYNDHLADHWLSHSERFLGSILVNHSDPAYAAKEIDRVAKDKRFVQVIMGSGARTPFGQRFYHPIYEAAERNKLPVAFHPGTEGAGISGPPSSAGYPTRYMEWHNTLPTNYMAHLNSLVCEGVFEKFPGLKIVAVEGGIAWLPHLMWRMDKNYKALRSTTPWLKRLPSEYIIEHVRLTTQPIEEPDRSEYLLQILAMVQAEKTVMFSSDYPHWDNDAPNQILRNLPEPMKHNIFSGTASALYGITRPILTRNAESTDV